MDPTNLALLISELKRDEGVEYCSYRDTLGILTVGVGHNLEANPLPPDWKFPLNDAQVNQLLDDDLTTVFNELNTCLHWWITLDAVRQRVLANMCFQLGITKLLEFQKFLSALHITDYGTAAIEMKNSIWFAQSGQRSVRLCQAMATGIMPDEPPLNI